MCRYSWWMFQSQDSQLSQEVIMGLVGDTQLLSTIKQPPQEACTRQTDQVWVCVTFGRPNCAVLLSPQPASDRFPGRCWQANWWSSVQWLCDRTGHKVSAADLHWAHLYIPAPVLCSSCWVGIVQIFHFCLLWIDWLPPSGTVSSAMKTCPRDLEERSRSGSHDFRWEGELLIQVCSHFPISGCIQKVWIFVSSLNECCRLESILGFFSFCRRPLLLKFSI